MAVADWPAVAAIYANSLATNNVTFSLGVYTLATLTLTWAWDTAVLE